MVGKFLKISSVLVLVLVRVYTVLAGFSLIHPFEIDSRTVPYCRVSAAGFGR